MDGAEETRGGERGEGGGGGGERSEGSEGGGGGGLIQTIDSNNQYKHRDLRFEFLCRVTYTKRQCSRMNHRHFYTTFIVYKKMHACSNHQTPLCDTVEYTSSDK